MKYDDTKIFWESLQLYIVTKVTGLCDQSKRSITLKSLWIAILCGFQGTPALVVVSIAAFQGSPKYN